MTKKYTDEEIEKIIKQNQFLKKENYAFKQVINSKRFQYAEKIATVYNRFFPKSTVRRKLFEGSYHIINKPFASISRHKREKINRKIAKLSEGYKKIIVIDSIPWDDKLKQRPHHLANEFKKLGFFVIYFEGANYLQNFRIIEDGLVTINSHIYLKGLNTKGKKCYFLLPNTMATPIEDVVAVKEYGFEIIYEYIDEFHGDISGDLSVQLEVWNNLNMLEPVLCVASARALEADLRTHMGKKQKIVLAQNAVFVEHFDYRNKSDIPSDMQPIVNEKKPIIGFYGALAPWIDFDLINSVAKKHKEWNIVLLGIDYNNAAKELAKENNIYNLGPKKYEQLSGYAGCFNCAIIPFKHGEIAKATSPIKLFEYMAAGLPTVCTRDLTECAGYKYVFMAKDNNEFEADLKKAIELYNDKEVRLELLRQADMNTWSKRAKDIVDALK